MPLPAKVSLGSLCVITSLISIIICLHSSKWVSIRGLFLVKLCYMLP